jgi:predicted DNA-binding protein
MATMVKQTAFRFTEEDLDLLDAIQKHTGVSTRVDALRAVLRTYARAEGIEVGKPRKGVRKGGK